MLAAEADRLAPRQSARPQMIYMGDQHDAVVDDDAEEDQKSQGSVVVKGHVEDIQPQGHADEGEGNGEDDDEGMDQGLEERGHDEVDQQDGKNGGEVVVAGFLSFPARRPPQIPGIAGG